jgi:hypothetical protein
MKFFPITHYEALMSSIYGSSIKELFHKMSVRCANMNYVQFANTMMDQILEELKNANDLQSAHMVGIEMLSRMMQDQESINLMGNMLYHCWQVQNNGNKIYYVAKNLCHRLIHTRVNVSCRYLKSPFEEIYVYLDQDEIVIDDVIDKTQRPMHGMYIGLKKEDDGKTRMRILASSGGMGLEKKTDINYHYVLTIPDDEATIDDAMNGMMDDLAAGKITAFSLTETNRKMMNDSFKLAANVLLYITSKDADLFSIKPAILSEVAGSKKNPAKAKRLLEKNGHCAQYPFIKVGYNVPSLEREAYTTGLKGGRITCMFSVSGHWRWQWKGPKESQSQEHIWIAPYTKGRGLIEGLHKKYLVEE